MSHAKHFDFECRKLSEQFSVSLSPHSKFLQGGLHDTPKTCGILTQIWLLFINYRNELLINHEGSPLGNQLGK